MKAQLIIESFISPFRVFVARERSFLTFFIFILSPGTGKDLNPSGVKKNFEDLRSNPSYALSIHLLLLAVCVFAYICSRSRSLGKHPSNFIFADFERLLLLLSLIRLSPSSLECFKYQVAPLLFPFALLALLKHPNTVSLNFHFFVCSVCLACAAVGRLVWLVQTAALELGCLEPPRNDSQHQSGKTPIAISRRTLSRISVCVKFASLNSYLLSMFSFASCCLTSSNSCKCLFHEFNISTGSAEIHHSNVCFPLV